MIGGPVGSGKGYLIEVFGRLLFGRERRVIKLNASFYRSVGACMEFLYAACSAHDASTVPGESPIRLLHVEGIEKAPAPLLDMFIHVFANGELTVRPGMGVDFSRTFLVLETGLAEREVDQLASRPVGFRATDPEVIAETDAHIREHIHNRIFSTFPLRFLALVDDVVIFRRIGERDLPSVLERGLSHLDQMVAWYGLRLHVDDAVCSFLLSEGRRSLRFGAKGLKQAMDRHLETPLIDLLSSRPMPPGSVIYARRSMEGVSLFVPTLDPALIPEPRGSDSRNGLRAHSRPESLR